jgi:hypothetical protein
MSEITKATASEAKRRARGPLATEGKRPERRKMRPRGTKDSHPVLETAKESSRREREAQIPAKSKSR